MTISIIICSIVLFLYIWPRHETSSNAKHVVGLFDVLSQNNLICFQLAKWRKSIQTAFSVEFRWYSQTTFSTFVIIMGFAVSINYFLFYLSKGIFLMNDFLPERKISKKVHIVISWFCVRGRCEFKNINPLFLLMLLDAWNVTTLSQWVLSYYKRCHNYLWAYHAMIKFTHIRIS